MDDNEKITLSQWNKLTTHKKETLRKWAIQNGYELDIVPGVSGSFDPSCEYAALLTKPQVIEFLNSVGVSVRKAKNAHNEKVGTLWNKLKESIK